MKTALVTGASRGIGRAIALELKSKDFSIIGTATSQAGVDALIENGIEGYILDLNSPNSIGNFWEQLEADKKNISVLVNNAGITRDNIVLRMSDDEWSDIMNVHLNGTFQLCKRSLKMMLKNKWGRIINISSASASIGNRGQSNYAAAKAGVEAFTKSLAKEVGKRDITINAVAPGFIATDMTEQNDGVNAEYLIKEIPLGRFGEPEEVAGLVKFLCSEKASYITGQTIHINGGLYM
ncbi:3-oxoacyl-ACP reductase FabG [Gammaproteobacteria bacterium]|jgi:3-oxoacyl-[acyl-carrier protein] reductase|nr:3-oxoacyl-ACP reductase FabG [Gammaproteobacteria bacterium]